MFQNKDLMPDLKGAAAPVFILVRPQMAENMGMAARAMMNCGLYQMRIVAPRDNPKCEKALRASSGADEILLNARVFDSLEEACSDLTCLFATTARIRDMVKPVYTAESAVPRLAEQLEKGGRTGILFGPERTGLENDEVAFTDGIIEIPLNPEHTSLNLSQAVLLVGYECFKGLLLKRISVAHETDVPATKSEMDMFLTHLETLLQERDYFKIADKKPRMLRNLTNIFTRNALTAQEIRTLHGVLNALTRSIKK